MASGLDGIRVLTVEEKLPVTYCSMLLADLGADVIIIERPRIGNPARLLPNFLVNTNRNKRSLSLNLKSDKGKEIFNKLAKDCDVIIECMRPGVVNRLGIDYESIKKMNPKIVYCSVSGYGQDGPYRDWAGHDPSYLGIAGILNFTPKDAQGDPCLPGIPMADLSAGMFATIAIQNALLAREKLGKGQYIDVSMTDGLVSWLSLQLGMHFVTGSTPKMISEPAMGVFGTKDGKHLTLSIAHEDYFWRNLCIAIDRPDIADVSREDRGKKHEELVSILKKSLLTKTRDEWITILSEADVPCAPVFNLDEVIDSPHFQHRKMIVDVNDKDGKPVKQVAHPTKYSDTKTEIKRLSPELGEHTKEILISLCYTSQEIKELSESGSIQAYT